MHSLLERKLIVVTGKGGVGKTTIAAALGLLAAQRGRRTIVVEVGDQARLPELFEHPAAEVGAETVLQEDLSSISVDPDRALLEWLQQLGGRVPGRFLASSSTFQYFAAAAPGAKELVSMVKIWELTQGERWQRRAPGYDLVVLDAPATGHALGMLASPHTFGAIARVGPVAGQSKRIAGLLEDPANSAYLGVALASEMAVTETLELQEGLQRSLGRSLSAVIVNGVLPQRFSTGELRRVADTAARDGHAGAHDATEQGLLRSAANAARAIHDRARFQQNQVARLRRRGLPVVSVPFLWAAELDLPAVQRIAERLGRRLSPKSR